jgi:hypothetical protein
MPDLNGRKIDQDTIERFNRFNRIMSDFRGDARDEEGRPPTQGQYPVGFE